jgi:hypothetical protein
MEMLTKRVLQAVDGSIRHWLRDAVMPLELDHGIFFTHRPSGVFSAQRCALCQLFVLKQDHCHCCPLFRVEGVWCTSLGSTYTWFVTFPSLAPAKAMVAKLVEARIYVEQIKGENYHVYRKL